MLKQIKYVMLLPCLTFLATSSAIAQSNKKERWFEVEVLLFQQLGDKTLLKEQFPEDTPSAALSLRNKRFIELLSPFLKPDISALKLQLPQCGSDKVKPSFIEQAALPTPLYTLKSLDQIDKTTNIEVLSNNSLADYSIDNQQKNNEDFNLKIENSESTTNNSAVENNLQNDAALNSEELTTLADNALNEEDTFTLLSAEMQLLVLQADQEFSPFKFNLSTDHLPTKTPHKRQQLCQLSAQVLANLATEDPQFKADNFTVDKVPNTINAAEDVYSKKPYLLSKASLKLNDVVKQLRWSKQFKPLLHIGWRLAPKGRNKAIPLHFFAGDNLQANYQQQLSRYNQALAKALAQESQTEHNTAEQNTVEQTDATNNNVINNKMNGDLAENSLEQGPQLLATSELTSEATQELTPEQQYQQKVNERLTQILTQLNQFNESNNDKTIPLQDVAQLNLDKLINELKQPTLALKLNSKIDELEKKYHLSKPLPPLQDWFVDGWFKVHLNHYLFISFDMTVVNKTLTEQASDELKVNFEQLPPLKLIEFKQDRRVISKEIHYFDNPYLGMVVQIRRHQRPQPPIEEEESKVIAN